MNLKEKVAIVTGAGQGIGLEICKQLISAGAKVLLNDLDSDLAEEAITKIEGNKGNCIAFPGDSGYCGSQCRNYLIR
jgi:3-oxoacyl-[acyl-carrier protein] reductase